MNIQFVIKDEKVYVIEVNPRASRTVPFLSKVTNIPMAQDLQLSWFLVKVLKNLVIKMDFTQKALEFISKRQSSPLLSSRK